MASDIYTTTPGSAVADELQQILAQRKLEARQALLDKLNEDQVRHGMGIQDSNLELARNRDRRDGDRQTFDMTREKIEDIPGGATADSITDKGAIDYARSLGMFRPGRGATPSVSTETDFGDGQTVKDPTATFDPATGGQDTFVGNDAYQKEHRELERIMGARNDPGMRTGSPLEQYLIGQAGGMNIPTTLLGRPPTQRILSPGGAIKQQYEVGINDPAPLELNHPPQPNASSRPTFVGTDPQGMPIMQQPDGSLRVTPIIGVDGKPTNTAIGAKPSASKPNTTLVPSGAWQQLTLAKGATNIGAAQRAARIQQAAAGIVAQARTTPRVKAEIDAIMSDITAMEAVGQTPPTLEEIFGDNQMEFSDLTPQEQSDLYSILYGFINGVVPE